MMFSFITFSFIIALLMGLEWSWQSRINAPSPKQAARWTCGWVSLALLFSLYIYYTKGLESTWSYLTGYLIEISLSIDNLFVFLLIFKYFQTPFDALYRVLFWGILGAIVMRVLFIIVGFSLISYFHGVLYIFGFFLIFTGITLGLEKSKKVDPEKNPVIRLFRYFFTVHPAYLNHDFFVVKDTKYLPTPLFIVLLAISTTDIIFAMDSIPAILAITNDLFIIFTSNIFAVLGLRSLFFLLQSMMMKFYYLNLALSLVLILIGIKMLLSDIIKIPIEFTLILMACILLLSIILSRLYRF